MSPPFRDPGAVLVEPLVPADGCCSLEWIRFVKAA